MSEQEKAAEDIFPTGAPVSKDEGQLEIRMGVQEAGGTVTERQLIVDFGKNVSWIAFNKAQGMAFAEQFMERLKQL